MAVSERTRVAEGIYRDKYGLDARVTVKGEQRTRRFKFEEPIDRVKLWQDETRAALRKKAVEGAAPAPPPPTNGTLAAEGARYLAQIGGKSSFKSDRSNVLAWIERLGPKPTSRITTEEVNLSTTAWKLEGYSDQTIKHRLRVLREMYETLYGKDARNPVRGARRPPKPQSNPVDVPIETITAVEQKMLAANDPLAYAIYLLRATTGQRPSQINRARPEHLRLTGPKPKWMVLDAKGASSHTVELNKDQVKAWKLFAEADGWGKVDTNTHADKMHAAGWPKTIRPYNLRHALAFAAMEQGADISDVAALLGHHDISTTQRTYYKHQEKRMRRISTALEGRFDAPKGDGNGNHAR